jgi:hypothetical protein
MFSQQTTIRFEKLGHVDGLGIYDGQSLRCVEDQDKFFKYKFLNKK